MITKPILRDVPEGFTTERLLIRVPRPGDGSALFAAVMESMEELQPWMPWATQTNTVEDSEEVVRRAAARYQAREDFMLLLWHKTNGWLVGASGLHRAQWSVPSFEIGYWIRTTVSGHGYVTEAVLGIAGFAFKYLDAERLEIRCDEKNGRSAAVARRAGFTLEGILRHNERHHASGDLRNTMVFACLRSEFLT